MLLTHLKQTYFSSTAKVFALEINCDVLLLHELFAYGLAFRDLVD